MVPQNIYFYEVTSSNYNRYVNEVSKRVIKRYKDANIFYIRDSFDQGKIILNGKLKRYVTLINKKDIKQCIKDYKPDVFVCFAFRISDIYWTFYFNRLSATTIQVQHGLYIEYFSRNFVSLFKRIPRIASYLAYLLKLFVKVRFKFSTVANILKKDIKFINQATVVDKDIQSNHIVIWGEYWKEWYRSKFFYDESSQFHICGSFDLEILDNAENIIETSEESVTYVCQTLVEDGRLKRKYFDMFLDKFLDFTDSYAGTVYIKLHPRSNREMYRELDKKKNIIITDKFPISEIYIGHYSTLLSVCSYLQKKLLLVEFPRHPIPVLFKKMSKNIIDYTESIDIKLLSDSSEFEAEYYYEYTKDPYDRIARIVLNS